MVKRARSDVRMTQKELAAAAGLQQPNIALIESGARVPSAELLRRILDAAQLRPSIALEFYADEIVALAAQYGISNVRVFGSTVHGRDTARSDIDLLLSVDDDVDYLALAAFRQAVEDVVGFPVDAVIDDPSNPVVQAIYPDAVPL